MSIITFELQSTFEGIGPVVSSFSLNSDYLGPVGPLSIRSENWSLDYSTFSFSIFSDYSCDIMRITGKGGSSAFALQSCPTGGHEYLGDVGAGRLDYFSGIPGGSSIFGFQGQTDSIRMVDASLPQPSAAVPEPSAFALSALGLLFMVLIWRMRNAEAKVLNPQVSKVG